MKQSVVEKVVAEMAAEKRIVDSCIAELGTLDDMLPAVSVLTRKSDVLASCIACLSGNGTEASKPTRTRKGRKAGTDL